MGKDMETAAQQSTGTGLAVQAGTRTVGGGHRATESHEKEGRKKERKKGRTPLLLFSSDLISFIFVPVASASVRWLCAAGAVRIQAVITGRSADIPPPPPSCVVGIR